MSQLSNSDFKNILNEFLIRHAGEIEKLGWGEEDLTDTMKNPIQGHRRYTELDIQNFETLSGLLIPVELRKFLISIGKAGSSLFTKPHLFFLINEKILSFIVKPSNGA